MKLEIFDPLFDLSSWMDHYPFVIWRKPGEVSQNGFRASVEILADESYPVKDAFIFSPFNKSGNHLSLAFYPLEDNIAFGSSTTDIAFTEFIPTDIPDDRAAYNKRVELLTHMMHEGPLHKCVLSRRVDLEGPDESCASALFSELCSRYPSAFISLIHIPGVFTWLGATPERFLKVRDHKAHTTALAATRPYKGSLPDIFEWNEKEKEEQQLVTDYILDVLRNKEIKSIECNGPLSMQAGNLVHLKTEIQFSITDKTNILSLIKALHPTPAVCGIPKNEAFRMINSLEPHDREYYAGYLGLVGQDELELYVNLRCMRWIGGKPSLFVGGGITAASISEQEWDETNFKSRTLLDVIEKICNLAGKKPNAH